MALARALRAGGEVFGGADEGVVRDDGLIRRRRDPAHDVGPALHRRPRDVRWSPESRRPNDLVPADRSGSGCRSSRCFLQTEHHLTRVHRQEASFGHWSDRSHGRSNGCTAQIQAVEAKVAAKPRADGLEVCGCHCISIGGSGPHRQQRWFSHSATKRSKCDGTHPARSTSVS